MNIKINIFLILVTLVFSACSPKYEVRKTYDSANANISCINSCENNEKQCNTDCRKSYNICLSDARVRANDMIYDYDREYKVNLYHYKKAKNNYDREYKFWLKEYENIQFDYDYYNGQCNISKNKNSYECKKKEYFSSRLTKYTNTKPTEPIKIKRVRLSDLVVQEQSSCTLNCGCTDVYDRCFSKCGGKITYQKFCISNCDD